jgi:acetoacetyl-CoA synthetase
MKLGMAVSVFDYAGNDVSASGEPGDLVCTTPFPAEPPDLFWPPGPTGLGQYQKSYFDVFGPSIWHHGDYVRLNPETGGVVMLDRVGRGEDLPSPPSHLYTFNPPLYASITICYQPR